MYEAVGFTLFILAALGASNLLYSLTRNFVFSRKLAHGLVGLAILSTPTVFDTPLVPVSLATTLLIVFCLTHTREIFYGVAKRGRFSEIYFAFSCAVCLGSGWWIDPYIGVAAALYLAWGDGVTGIVRWLAGRRHAKLVSGTCANFVVCSAIALLVTPYWVGWVGGVGATALEHLCGDVGKVRWVDDNLASPLGALLIMGGLSL